MNIGDRVRVKKEFDRRNLEGRTGTIICSAKEHYSNLDWGVEFDEPLETWGHDCHERGKDGYCRYGRESELELISDNKIVITTNGKEVLARLYENNKVIKTATAKCYPEDTFNFETGAEIAFKRLFDDVKAKPEPIKIEIGKKYLLKPYDEVEDHIGISRSTWNEITKRYVVVEVGSENYCCHTCYHGSWVFAPEAFEREYIEETKAETTTESELKVGDLVKVINDGEHYPDYREWLTKNAPQLEKYFAKGDDLKNGEWGVIRAIAPHGDRLYRILCAIELPKNKVFIIGAKGLEKLSK